MTMNLIQIQDKLKSLPNDPRVMQLLTGYANGQNPQVPPYLALGELNRRKIEAEKNQMQQAGQPPGGTVKDQIEQQAGVMALKQGQQQQAMQNMMRQGMAGSAPVPQNTPQPQAQGQVMAAAGGGLASLAPKGYRSGGVIAFKEGNLVDDVVVETEGEETEQADLPTDPRKLMARLMQQAAAIQNAKAPKVESRDETTKRMIEADPDRYGILNTPVGQSAMKRLDELQGNRRSELATQREELAKSKPGILQLLGQAAMGTRGQKGGSALASILGGYSELASGADAKQLQQEQGLRMRELELQQARAEAMNKIEDAQRSQAEGNIDKARKEILDAQKIAKDLGISLNTLMGRQLTTAGALVESQRRADDTTRTIKSREDVAEARRKLDERLENIRANRPGENERQLARVEKLRKEGKIDEANQLLKDIRDIKGGASDIGRDRADRVAITDLIRNRRLDLADAEKGGLDAEAATIRAEIAELTTQLKTLTPKSNPTGSGPKPITPAEFDAKWNTLKKGQTLVGPDGKTYTKG
jgi:hypothetical protein